MSEKSVPTGLMGRMAALAERNMKLQAGDKKRAKSMDKELPKEPEQLTFQMPLIPNEMTAMQSTHLTAGLHLLLGHAGRVAATGISIAAQLPADGRRGSVDQAGNPAQAETLGMTDLNGGALFNAEFGIRHRDSTVPERSGVALSFRRRPNNACHTVLS